MKSKLIANISCKLDISRGGFEGEVNPSAFDSWQKN